MSADQQVVKVSQEGEGQKTSDAQNKPTVLSGLSTVVHAAKKAKDLFQDAQVAVSVDVEGLENIPEGPAILAVNHRFGNDFLRLSSVIERPLKVIELESAADSRAGKRRNRLQEKKNLRRRHIPLTAAGGQVDAVDVLAAGDLVVIFPEASPSPDGCLHKGSPEVAWLAMTSKVQVVPVGIVPASSEGLPGRAMARVLGPLVRIGEPIDFSKYWTVPALSDALDGVLLRGCTAEIMGAIAQLSKQIYQDNSPQQAKDLMREQRYQAIKARAEEFPTAAERRRVQAERRERMREADQLDLERAAEEAARKVQAGGVSD